MKNPVFRMWEAGFLLAEVFLLVMVVWGSVTVGYTRVDGSDMARDGSESTIDGSDHKTTVNQRRNLPTQPS